VASIGGLPQALGDSRIAEGIKEALRVGTQKGVQLVGCLNGYFLNQMIKILMPEQWRHAIDLMQKFGLAKQVEEFEVSMNRAAEQAAPLSVECFINCIAGLTFDDVKRIWKGGDTAATQYLEARTSQNLLMMFKPIIIRTMEEFGVTRLYHEILDLYKKFSPFHIHGLEMDIQDYVAGRALHGLFVTIAQEEREIRRNPAARVTELLREVFGSLESSF